MRLLCFLWSSAVALLFTTTPSWAQNPPTGTGDFMPLIPVLTHPRCQNCHTLTNFPRQGDDRHRHISNVQRGPDGHGVMALTCATCHGSGNGLLSGVPGAQEDWHLAPLSMGWEGLMPAEICRNLKDPKRNGNRNGKAIIDHLNTHLVEWAWSPGNDLSGKPRSVPPISHAEFVAAAQRWVDAGAVCPAANEGTRSPIRGK
jgi:hypothetical protein